jgi:hypothetical protein
MTIQYPKVIQILVQLMKDIGNQDIFNLGMLLSIVHQFIKKCPPNDLDKKFKDSVIKLFDAAVAHSTRETMSKQKLIKQENLVEKNPHLDISSQMFQFISIMLPSISNVMFDQEKDLNTLLNLMLTNLISILKLHHLENMVRFCVLFISSTDLDSF